MASDRIIKREGIPEKPINKIKCNGNVMKYCNICNKYFAGSTYNFKCHLYQHKALKHRYTCKYCNMEFYRGDVHKLHLKRHLGEHKRYICDYCGVPYIDKRNLILHISKIHENVNAKVLYRCEFCDVSYKEGRLLKYHIRREHYDLSPKHDGLAEKSINDTWVERIRNSNMYVRMKKVNNNVITIQKCINVVKLENDTPSQRNPLQYTQMSNEKQYVQYTKAICDYCGKEMLKKSLRMHIMERHMKTKKFTCNICNRGYSRLYMLKKHACGNIKNKGKRMRIVDVN